jgi:5-methyltetrahydropteroyltriglutamate--homocysteine methyltransferase
VLRGLAVRPPFRAEHVGSLLRPPELRAAHEQALAGRLAPEALRELQDRHIREAIVLQETVGLQAITDGEFRRTSFHSDFIEKLEGARAAGSVAAAGQFGLRAFEVNGKLRWRTAIEGESFRFLAAHTRRTPKQTIPSPTMLLRGGRAAVSTRAYPDLAEFHADVVAVYRKELHALATLGCSYVQLDDTNFAYLCDPRMTDLFRAWGYDPAALPMQFARLINAVIAARPSGMVVGIHLCRGNSSGQWAAQGAYEPVAEVLFNAVEADAYFLEYDDARSGGFQPLRHFPRDAGKKVVLGLVSSKHAELEPADALKRRIEEAARYVPLEQLCLSPQCGFASTFRGNPLTEEAQRRKLERIVEVAADLWGSQ